MATFNNDIIHNGTSEYWLDDFTSVHWVNENSCLLQAVSAINDSSEALLEANHRIQLWTLELSNALPAWLENYVPSFTSLLIVHDLGSADKFLVLNWLKQSQKKRMYRANPETEQSLISKSRHHIVDVCYSQTLNEFLLQRRHQKPPLPNDLELVSRHLSLTCDDIIKRHSSQHYRVFSVGFLPNFAYMGLTDISLSMPRLKTPRKRVPAGAVAIADNQTAVYPQTSPGGWHVLGHTPFDLGINGKIKFHAGDTVSFRAISELEYYEKAFASD